MDVLMAPDGSTQALRLEDYATLHPLPDDGAAVQIGALRVAWRPTVHHIPTSALRIEAGAQRFGYSADTAFDPALIDWLAASDLFLHETNYGIHTPLEKLVSLPEAQRARMRLIHYPDTLDPDAAPIACAREGDAYTL
jgi:hypothetical protein